jgi:hypothetical protein
MCRRRPVRDVGLNVDVSGAMFRVAMISLVRRVSH